MVFGVVFGQVWFRVFSCVVLCFFVCGFWGRFGPCVVSCVSCFVCGFVFFRVCVCVVVFSRVCYWSRFGPWCVTLCLFVRGLCAFRLCVFAGQFGPCVFLRFFQCVYLLFRAMFRACDCVAFVMYVHPVVDFSADVVLHLFPCDLSIQTDIHWPSASHQTRSEKQTNRPTQYDMKYSCTRTGTKTHFH